MQRPHDGAEVRLAQLGGDPYREEEGMRDMFRSIAHRSTDHSPDLPIEGRLPGFIDATSWLNSDPLTPDGLRGRVVLVDFWTYTCINWLRTLPYLRAWDAKYRDHGLTIVGVHTPEFGFERTVDNIVARARGFGVDFPTAIDSDYGVWTAFANHFWPAVYLADAEGRIRYHHFGEGEYAMTEMVIQQLLADAGTTGFDPGLASVDPHGFEVAADWTSLRSPETYLGYGRSSGLAASGDARLDESFRYPESPRLSLNQWAPSGTWTIAQHAAVLDEPGGTIAIRFQARDVNLVMGPATPGASVPFRVRLDGTVPETGALDVDDQGNGMLADQRLHQLIRQSGRIQERTLLIEFLEAGAEAYCFTFG